MRESERNVRRAPYEKATRFQTRVRLQIGHESGNVWDSMERQPRLRQTSRSVRSNPNSAQAQGPIRRVNATLMRSDPHPLVWVHPGHGHKPVTGRPEAVPGASLSRASARERPAVRQRKHALQRVTDRHDQGSGSGYAKDRQRKLNGNGTSVAQAIGNPAYHRIEQPPGPRSNSLNATSTDDRPSPRLRPRRNRERSTRTHPI